MDGVTVQLLGTFAAQTANKAVARFRSDKVRALLAYLAVEADQPHTRASLAGLLWPEQPDDIALRNLSQALVQLRAALDDAATQPLLLISRQTIQWNSASGVQLDLADFTRLARSADTVEREQAAALYRGEFLTGFSLSGCEAFEEWQLLTREHLQRQMLEVLDSLAQAYLAMGDSVAAEATARRQLAIDEWREAAHRQLMLALAASGQRASALVQYERCRALLLAELGAEPDPTTTALYEQIRANIEPSAEAVSPVVAPVARHSLPTPPDRLIGREDDLARLSALLHEPAVRLVTLVGGGGTGKTRLALAAAWALAPERSSDLCWVSLGGVSSGEAALTQTMIATTVLAALDPSHENAGTPLVALRGLLRARPMLLVLDNCEHLRASAAALIHDLLDAAPGVRVLATSRERLQLRGEHVVLLDGLPVPTHDGDDPRPYAGVHLFLARAAQRAPDFSPDDAMLGAVGRLCRLLGGLPLALELAASWVAHYHCDEIAAGVSSNLAFLAARDSDVPERQRSLQATFTYSWNILSDAEQMALAQLSVFQSAFDRPAALAVAGADVATLAALVDRSLLRQLGIGRYELHPLLRQFAAAQLAAAGPARGVDTANRHSAYYLALAGMQAAALHGPHPQAARQALQESLSEIRQACLWTLTGGQFDLLETHFTAVASLFNALGLIVEGETFLEQVLATLDRSEAVSQQPHLRGWALAELARLQFGRAKTRQGLATAEAAVAAAERAADRDGLVAGYLMVGNAHMLLGEVVQAQAWLERGLALAQVTPLHHAPTPGHGMAIMLPILHNALAMVAVIERQFATADDHEAMVRQLNQTNGDWWGMALTAWWSGLVYLRIGHYLRALTRFRETLGAAERLGVGWYAQDCRIRIGQCLARLGRYAEAVEMFEWALASSHTAGNENQGCLALSTLSLVASQQGDGATALRYGREARRLAETLEAYDSGQLTARLALGAALLGLEQAAEASSVYGDALQRCRNGDSNAMICTFLSGEAAAVLLRGDRAQARIRAEELLERVADMGYDGLVTPLEVELVCYQILAANDDPRAPALLKRARAVLHEQAGWIDEPDARRAFLEHVPAHRTLLAAAT